MSKEYSNQRFPDWKKVFVSILENQIETVLGENAIKEIKQPLLLKALSEKLGGIYDSVERQFLQQVANQKVKEAIASLPLASLPSIQRALGEFFQQPQANKLAAVIKVQLKLDSPELPEDELDSAIQLYIKILQSELVPLSEEFQRMSIAYSVAQISDHTNQLEVIVSLLRQLVNNTQNSTTGLLPPVMTSIEKIGGYMSSNFNPKIDFILITALEEERDALLKKLPGYRRLPPSDIYPNFYYSAELPITFSDNSKNIYNLIILPLLGMGRVQAAASTANAIQRWKPRYVLLIGIAGGVAGRGVKIGDILISDQIVDYELQKITKDETDIRWDVHRASRDLLAASREFQTDNAWELLDVKRPGSGQSKRLIGPIASGDKVIAFDAVLEKYREIWSRLIGIEMEASGVATAAYSAANPPGFFMVRSVSDLANKDKGSRNVEKWRDYACDAAASYAIALLKSGPVPAMHEGAPTIHVMQEWTDYEQYPWQPFLSFRYLESLDSTRFNNMTQSHQIRVLSAKSELLDTLLFGDAIALSENQIIDSRGAIESLSELIEGAKEVGVKIPIRVASRIPNQSVFTLMSQRIGNIDDAQIDKRFVISANPALDLDIDRRKQWSEYLAQGIKGLDNILKRSSSSEAEFVGNWFTTLNYVDKDNGLVIGAQNIPDRFPHEIKQILNLSSGDLDDMCSQIKDANIPEIMQPQWFINKEEAAAAGKIISGLRTIVDQIGSVPNARSPIYTKLAELEKSDPSLVEGIREIVDSIYNFTMGIAVRADSLSDTTGGDTRNILVRAGHALSQWVRQTEKNPEGGYVYELPWAWGGASQLTWSNKIESEQINKVVKEVPWRAVLEATKESSWKASLANYRTAVEILQSIDRNSISLGAMGKEWRQNHHDAHKVLNEAWQKHIEISARLISNQAWKLTSDGIQYHLPDEGNRPLQVFQNSRTMGTVADYSVEMPLFRSSVIQKTEFEQNIFGAINEIAQKRQH